MENIMQFSGIINSEEMMAGSLLDSRRIYVPCSMYEYAPEEQRNDPEWWLLRYEMGDFEDDENDSMVWVEGEAKMKIVGSLEVLQ